VTTLGDSSFEGSDVVCAWTSIIESLLTKSRCTLEELELFWCFCDLSVGRSSCGFCCSDMIRVSEGSLLRTGTEGDSEGYVSFLISLVFGSEFEGVFSCFLRSTLAGKSGGRMGIRS